MAAVLSGDASAGRDPPAPCAGCTPCAALSPLSRCGAKSTVEPGVGERLFIPAESALSLRLLLASASIELISVSVEPREGPVVPLPEAGYKLLAAFVDAPSRAGS